MNSRDDAAKRGVVWFTESIRFRYQTVEFGSLDVHLRGLRDTQECGDDEVEGGSSNWALFGVLWPSGESLAYRMTHHDVVGRRILEVGCGLGLASLVLNHRRADITATDFHPEVGGFLAHNVALNGGPEIPFIRADWADEESGLGLFDLIIGSDLLYERGHAELLSEFIDRHARPTCEVIIVDPGRGQTGRFGRLMESRGYAARKLPASPGRPAPARERTHSYTRGIE